MSCRPGTIATWTSRRDKPVMARRARHSTWVIWTLFNRGWEASILLVAAGVVAWLSDDVVVRELGYVSLTFGVDATLFMTVLAGVAVGVASLTRTPWFLPWGSRQRMLQQVWVTGAAVAGWACLVLAGGRQDAPALARNVLVFGGVSVLAGRVGAERAVWLPAVAWMVGATFVGRIAESPAGLAFVIDESTAGWHWVVAATSWVVGAGACAKRRGTEPLGHLEASMAGDPASES